MALNSYQNVVRKVDIYEKDLLSFNIFKRLKMSLFNPSITL